MERVRRKVQNSESQGDTRAIQNKQGSPQLRAAPEAVERAEETEPARAGVDVLPIKVDCA